MKENRTHMLLILVFVAMIILPQVVFWIMNKEVLEVSITENRKLNPKPEFKIATITEYPKKFDDYYNDHLPFRTELKKAWTNLNYNMFYTTVENKVVIGKEGWLFYRAEESIEQAQGIARYSQKQKEDILYNLQHTVAKLREKNIETYALILPNRENLYREKLPDSILIKSDISKAEELIQYIRKNSDIKLIYPKEELLKAKEKYQVCRKYDTHWNKVGAFIGTICLQKGINPEFEYDLDNLEIEKLNKKDLQGLAGAAGLQDVLFEDVIRVKNFYEDVKYTVNSNNKYKEYTSNAINDKTVLFIGDSFREDMEEYFSKLYKKVIYMHRSNYSEDLIEKIKPDIVVIEAVERCAEAIGKQYINK